MKIFLTFIISAIILVLIALAYYGAFKKIEITEHATGPYLLVYKKHIGDYKNVGPVMDKIYKDLLNDSVVTTRGFGLYYDNPGEVEKDKLRSIVGCILEEKDRNKIDNLKDKYTITEFPVSNSVISQFPFKGKPSIFLGIFKIYPPLSDYLKEHNYAQGPIMEIYNVPAGKILYIAPVNIDKKFYDSLLETEKSE
ncbi:MAG: GyrI-like domain-containing protein [Candidatus Theseobacter exili]|nr:GyrI-like domain-containing protein [Candidatus Theseobacter exili]